MIVICLEGCHGCGKTQLCQQFKDAGFSILDEAFLDMPEYMIDPQSLLMETTWVCSWFERLLKQANDLKTSGREAIFIADRSPFSAVFYSKNGQGKLLEPVIRAHIKEIQAAAAIDIYTVYLQVKPDLLWSRIQDRLRREPSRKKYNEDKREWMNQTLSFYESFKWDLKAPNNDITLRQLRDGLIRNLSGRSPRFQRTILSPHTLFSEDARAACSPVPRSPVPMAATASSPEEGTAGAGAGAGAGSSPESREGRSGDISMPSDVATPAAAVYTVSPAVPSAKAKRTPLAAAGSRKRKAPPSPVPMVSPDDVKLTGKAPVEARLGGVAPMQSLS